MSNGIEYSDGFRGDAAYPAAWGRPRGAWDSEERAAWVRECIRKHAQDSVAAAYQRLAASNLRMTLWLRLPRAQAPAAMTDGSDGVKPTRPTVRT